MKGSQAVWFGYGVVLVALLLFVGQRLRPTMQLNGEMLQVAEAVYAESATICTYETTLLDGVWGQKEASLARFKPHLLTTYSPQLQQLYNGDIVPEQFLSSIPPTLASDTTEASARFFATLALDCSEGEVTIAQRDEWMLVALHLSEAAPYRLDMLQIASAYYRRTDNNEAVIPIYRERLILEPDAFLVYKNLGTAYLAEQQYEDAVATFEASLAITGTDITEAQIRLAESLYRVGDAEAALDVITMIMVRDENGRLHEKAHQASYYRGLALEQLTQTLAAVAAYEQALCYDDTHAPSRVRLVRTLMMQNELNKAAYHWQRLPEVRQQDTLFAEVAAFSNQFAVVDEAQIEADLLTTCDVEG